MCELPAHSKRKKESCASYISSPVNVIINICHSFWPGMCSALEYGEFLIRIISLMVQNIPKSSLFHKILISAILAAYLVAHPTNRKWVKSPSYKWDN